MKTTAKDIILLCKGWYDKEKYPTVLDALKQYYRKNYSEMFEHRLCEQFLLKCILINELQEVITQYPDRANKFINGYIGYNQLIFMPDENNRDYDYQLFYRIVHFFGNLQMHGEGLIDINTDDYFEIYESNKQEFRKLKEDII